MSGTATHPKPATFLNDVIRPALQAIELDSEAAEQLLLGTAQQESDLRATVQDGGGLALGDFQMEPNTHNDIWANYLAFHADLAGKVQSLAGVAAGHLRRPSLLPTIPTRRR
jgi:hypothetical protein